LDTLRPFCDEAAKERNTAKGTLRATVEDELQRTLPHGKARRGLVAKKLAMSARTLSRRLWPKGGGGEKWPLRRALLNRTRDFYFLPGGFSEVEKQRGS
jgi:hypothetical protein